MPRFLGKRLHGDWISVPSGTRVMALCLRSKGCVCVCWGQGVIWTKMRKSVLHRGNFMGKSWEPGEVSKGFSKHYPKPQVTSDLTKDIRTSRPMPGPLGLIDRSHEVGITWYKKWFVRQEDLRAGLLPVARVGRGGDGNATLGPTSLPRPIVRLGPRNSIIIRLGFLGISLVFSSTR